MNAASPLRLVVNHGMRRLESLFPGYFTTAKHNHYRDFGYPETLEFKQLYEMYNRNGIAAAGVNKTILKTWQDLPYLLEYERDGSEEGDEGEEETPLEKAIRGRFAALRMWQVLAEADRQAMVGAYSGVILRFADSKMFREPVDRVPGGLDGLVEVIPAWEGQLQVSEWDTDERSENYGKPTMYQFTEVSVETGKANKQPRQFLLHPDRVVIWSKDGTVNGRSALEPGYNDLLTLEKVSGAGGEGFWKNAKSAPVLEVAPEARLTEMAKAMNVSITDLKSEMDKRVADWQQGFDQLLMVQGMEAKTLGITLPSPEHFFNIALQSFAASLCMPTKILVGMQTGERASTEDATEWAQTNMSRRTNIVIPAIMSLVTRLVDKGLLPKKDWFIDWIDLTESSIAEKIDRAVKMADTNQKMKDTGELVFTPEEIRASVGYEPLSEAEKYRPEEDEPEVPGTETQEPVDA